MTINCCSLVKRAESSQESITINSNFPRMSTMREDLLPPVCLHIARLFVCLVFLSFLPFFFTEKGQKTTTTTTTDGQTGSRRRRRTRNLFRGLISCARTSSLSLVFFVFFLSRARQGALLLPFSLLIGSRVALPFSSPLLLLL